MNKDGRFIDLPSREQAPLILRSLRQEVEEESELLALDEAISQLDLQGIEAHYSRVGAPGYPPKVLLAVLIYGYSQGYRSSRQLAQLCKYDVRFRFLAYDQRPDFRTLCRFRRNWEPQLKALFRQTVALCQGAGLVLLGRVAADGSKVRANRSRRALAQAEQAFAAALTEAEQADADIAPEPQECALMKTTEGIRPAYNAQLAVDEANQVIVAQEVVTAPNDQGQLAPLMRQVQANCGEAPEAVLADGGYLGQEDLEQVQRQGTTPYLPVPEPAQGIARMEWIAQAFRCPQGNYLRAYRSRNGKQIYRTTRCQGCPQAGACGVTGRAKELHVLPESEALRHLIERMNETGKAIYRGRAQIVEPVFAWFKHNWGFRRFGLRGRGGARAEWSLLCIVHNLRKWMESKRKAAQTCAAFVIKSPADDVIDHFMARIFRKLGFDIRLIPNF